MLLFARLRLDVVTLYAMVIVIGPFSIDPSIVTRVLEKREQCGKTYPPLMWLALAVARDPTGCGCVVSRWHG